MFYTKTEILNISKPYDVIIICITLHALTHILHITHIITMVCVNWLTNFGIRKSRQKGCSFKQDVRSFYQIDKHTIYLLSILMYLDIKLKRFMKPKILKQCTGFCAWLRITNVSCKTKVLSNNYVLFHRVSTE